MVHFLGDTHGNMLRVMECIEEVECGDTIIHVGDFGLGFTSFMKDVTLLKTLSGQCATKDVDLYILRGNHDDPAFFAGSVMYFPHVHLVRDYMVKTIEGENYMFLGGAVSVDRNYRVNNRLPHWESSVIAVNPMSVTKEVIKSQIGMDIDPDMEIDVVVTHSAPREFEPCASDTYIVEQFAQSFNDPTLLDDCLDERDLLSRLLEVTQPKAWYYGHFHRSAKGSVGECDFTCCNIDELVARTD